MKRLSIIYAVAVFLCALGGCSGGAAPSDLATAISTPPLLVDRQLLVDAVWAEGDDIPADAACLAGSQFVFDAIKNPFNVMLNANTDEHYTMPVVASSSLTILMLEGDASARGEACAEGDLKYLVSASPINPVDIEVAGEGCPDLATIASSDDTGFPANGSVTAHFEAHEVTTVIAIGMNSSATDDSSTETGNPGEPTPQDDHSTFEYAEKMFKLVIDSCTGVDAPVDVAAE